MPDPNQPIQNINITSNNQRGGITAHTVNVGPQQRTIAINDTQSDVARGILNTIPRTSNIELHALMGDQEALNFAWQIMAWLRANGYTIGDENPHVSMFTQPIYQTICDHIPPNTYKIVVGVNGLPSR
jgi:hypothetical protein